jgi:hypothetical protein
MTTPSPPPPGLEVTPRRRFLCNPGAWLIGVPIGLLLSGLGVTGWSATHPMFVLAAAHLASGGSWGMTLDDAVMDQGEGWMSPGTWSWRCAVVRVLPQTERGPTIDLQDVVVGIPRVWWTPAGLIVNVPWATVGALALRFPGVDHPAPSPPKDGPGRLQIAVGALTVDAFAMRMAPGMNPAVSVDATDVRLQSTLWLVPDQRSVTGAVAVGSATATVAGIRMDEVTASRIDFTGDGLEVVASGKLGAASVDASLSVTPLFGRPAIAARAQLHPATLHGLADAVLGPGDMQLMGAVEASATLQAGGSLGPGSLRGTADLHIRAAGFIAPESKKAAVILAVALAPFLRYDEAGNVVVGDLHGGISFDQRGVSFDTVSYEAPHSTGELRGYVHGEGISAKLHFLPRPHSGAIEWGLIMRGATRKPKVGLALPVTLRAWTPCEDPLDCPLGGGAPKGGDARDPDDAAAAAALARDGRVEARAQRRADREAEKAASHDEHERERTEKREDRVARRKEP